MKRAIEDSLSILAGIGVGTALMYLLDPDNGEQRRQKIADGTRDALGEAGHAVSDTTQSFADRARGVLGDLSSGISDHADSATSSLRQYGNRFGASMSNGANYLPTLSGIQKRIADRISAAERNIHQRTKPHSTGEQIAGYTAGGTALLALGAGLAYLFDPTQGHARRTYLVDKTTSMCNEVGSFMRRTGKHFSNKAYGTAMEATRPIRKFRKERAEQSEQSNAGNEGSSNQSEPNSI